MSSCLANIYTLLSSAGLQLSQTLLSPVCVFCHGALTGAAAIWGGCPGMRSDSGMGAERSPFRKAPLGLAHLAEHRSSLTSLGLMTSMSSLLFTLGLGLRQNYQ